MTDKAEQARQAFKTAELETEKARREAATQLRAALEEYAKAWIDDCAGIENIQDTEALLTAVDVLRRHAGQ